jgi:hypothetical protein
MNARQHLAKARDILAGLAKLDPEADPLAIIDGTMIAGYHLANAVLHAHGVTDAAVHYNTPSKFEVELEAMRSHFVRNPNEPDAQGAAEAQRLLARMATLCDVN